MKALLVALGQLGSGRAAPSPAAQYELDPNVLGVLTEYEEHRLRTNIQQGLSLFRIRAQFSLASIDTALEDVKSRAKPHGEIITYLPTGSAGDLDSIELEILLASRADLTTLRGALAGANVTIDEVERSAPRASFAPPSPAQATAFQFSLPPQGPPFGSHGQDASPTPIPPALDMASPYANPNYQGPAAGGRMYIRSRRTDRQGVTRQVRVEARVSRWCRARTRTRARTAARCRCGR